MEYIWHLEGQWQFPGFCGGLHKLRMMESQFWTSQCSDSNWPSVGFITLLSCCMMFSMKGSSWAQMYTLHAHLRVTHLPSCPVCWSRVVVSLRWYFDARVFTRSAFHLRTWEHLPFPQFSSMDRKISLYASLLWPLFSVRRSGVHNISDRHLMSFYKVSFPVGWWLWSSVWPL